MQVKKNNKKQFKYIVIAFALSIFSVFSVFMQPLITANANVNDPNFVQALINQFSNDVIYQGDIEISVTKNSPIIVNDGVVSSYDLITTYQSVDENDNISLIDLVNSFSLDYGVMMYDIAVSSDFGGSFNIDNNSSVLLEISSDNDLVFSHDSADIFNIVDGEGSLFYISVIFDTSTLTELYSNNFTISIVLNNFNIYDISTINDFGILHTNVNDLNQFIENWQSSQTPTDNNIISVIVNGISGFGSAIISFITLAFSLFYANGSITLIGYLALVFISIGFIINAIRFVKSFF